MALAGGGRFTTGKPSRRFSTQVEVLKQFLEIEIKVEKVAERHWDVAVCRSPARHYRQVENWRWQRRVAADVADHPGNIEIGFHRDAEYAILT